MKKVEWMKLLERERALRLELLALGEDGDRDKRRDLSREWWGQIAKVLKAYPPALKDISPFEPHPTEITYFLAGLAGYLAVGDIPQPIADVRGRGRTAMGPTEETHVAYATAYMVAAKDKHLTDRNYFKTICDAYGVRRQTAQKWLKFTPRDDLLNLAKNNSSQFTKKMLQVGGVYRRAGRSSIAVSGRAKSK